MHALSTNDSVCYIQTLLWHSFGDSSALHCASCTAHKNHVIRRISAHIPWTRHWFTVNGPSTVERCDGLKLLNEHWYLYLLLYYFGVQIFPFKLEKLTEKSSKGAYTKPVTLWCKVWSWKQRLKERSIRSRISPFQGFLSCYFKNVYFQLPQN